MPKDTRRQRVQVVSSNQEVKGWFLTYPKCGLSPKATLALLQDLPIAASIEEYVISSELHQDGEPHVHAFVKYDSKVSFSKTRWDLPNPDGGFFHGNYQKSHSWAKCKAYIKKDGNFIASFDVDAALHKKAKVNKTLLQEDPCSLVDSGDIHLFQLKNLIHARALYFSLRAPEKPRAVGLVENPFGKLLMVWSAATKLRHWWFWSRAPNTGKTTFLRFLDSRYPCHWMAKEKFQSIHPETQFVLIDEYSVPWLPLFELNAMCDGTHQYPTKGGAPVQLKDPIVVICSNRPPEQVYPHLHDLIKVRFSVFAL